MAQEPTPEQHAAAHQAVLQRYGLPLRTAGQPSLVTSEVLQARIARGGDARDGVVFSSNPDESDVEPTLLDVRDIAHLKQLAGVPDEQFTSGGSSDAEIDYPEPPPASTRGLVGTARNECDLKDHLGHEGVDQVRRAAEAYLQGDSSKVRDYEEMINALHFPTRIAVFAGENLVVDTKVYVSGNDPVGWAYNSITVNEPNGQIIVQTNFSIDSQTFTVNGGQ